MSTLMSSHSPLTGNRDPVKLAFVLAGGNQREATRAEPAARELFGDVADGDHAAAAQNDAFECGRFVRKAKDAAGRYEFGDLRCRQREAALSETKKNEGLQRSFGSDGHCTCAPLFSTDAERVSAEL